MKTIKGLMLGIMFSSTLLSFSVPAFATEESSTTASEASVTTETSVTKTKAIEEKKEIDITPKFKINEKNSRKIPESSIDQKRYRSGSCCRSDPG